MSAYQIYILSRDKKTYQKHKGVFPEYIDALKQMRKCQGLLERNSDTRFEFISEEINESRGVHSETISYFIQVEG